jgi:glucokinase
MAERLAIGIDFGGTKILAGVVNIDNGKLLATGKKKTKQPHDEMDVIERIASVVDEAIDAAKVDVKKIVGVGIGAAGMVNREKGILLNAVNLGLKELPLTEPLSKRYGGVPCKLGNDVEVATLGELHFGAGRGCDNFICIFVGTGIGSGIVFDGKQHRGTTGTAGEVGHMIIEADGRLCACGARGCLETYASRTAVAKQIHSDVLRGIDTSVRDKIDMTKGILRSKVIADALDDGDEVVTRAVSDGARYMGMGLANVVNLINPERVILGGGLVEAVEVYYKLAAKEAHYRSLRIAAKKLNISKAQLGDYAGIIGAALLVR